MTATPSPVVTRGLTIERAGFPVLVQDLGRVGMAAVGVGESGAADRGSFRLGARLLANPPDRAALEITLGGVELTVHGTQTLALTGAQVPATLDGRPVPCAAPFTARDGQRLVVGIPERGLRTYLSTRGGIAVDPVLGSRSTDILSGVGPDQLTAGSAVLVGDPPTTAFPCVDVAPVRPLPDLVELRVDLGPRHAWIADPSALAAATWTVSDRSNRVGVRLDGDPLTRAPEYADRELPSEGVVLGSIQVPADGQPVIFLADHPVTGGYPVMGVVRAEDLDHAAQARPGQRLRFHLDLTRSAR